MKGFVSGEMKRKLKRPKEVVKLIENSAAETIKWREDKVGTSKEARRERRAVARKQGIARNKVRVEPFFFLRYFVNYVNLYHTSLTLWG